MAKDPYKYFRVEANELVEQLSRGVLDLKKGTSENDLVAQLLRLAHTLKGAAHVVKQPGIASLAHTLEDALVPHADQRIIPQQDAEAMLRLVDAIAAQVSALGRVPSSPAEEEISVPAHELLDTIRVDLSGMDTLLEGITETGVQLAGLKAKIAGIKDAADLAGIVLSQLQSPLITGGNGRPAVPVTKAFQIVQDLRGILVPLQRNLTSGLEQAERELALVRDTASQLRLVPASAVFDPLRRMVREAAQSTGKQVEFETAGGEHRLDAHVLVAVRDALLQLVRNAVVHGIEDTHERQAAAKPAAGKVFLQVQRRGNRVAFACHDDGRGFDVSALRAVAISRGILLAEEAEGLDTEDIYGLFLRGGISTSKGVTELAGRGIGLDLVRETAAKLKAEVTMHTYRGRGATVEISVPVSLLSLEGVLVESGEVSASLPLDAVQQTLLVAGRDILHTPEGDSLVFGDKTVPFLTLAHALGQEVRQPSSKKRFLSAVIIRSGNDLAALGVDRLLGTATVLLRPIPAFAGVDPVVAGAALDAEGNPQLVLDPASLVAAASGKRPVLVQGAPGPALVVLVIDDSLTTRMLEQSILESAGYEVHLAASGEEALEKARAQRYDLFLVDVEMPGIDGFEFIARTRADSALSEVPAILVTSRHSDADKRRGEEVGAHAFVVKGEFDQAQLMQTIRRLVG